MTVNRQPAYATVTRGSPPCLVPRGTSSSSTASAPRSARRARRASTHETRADDLVDQVHPGAAAAQPGPAARAGRRGRHRRHHADRRPGPDPRPHRRHPGRAAHAVPGFSIDRMCAGAMTAVTTTAGGIAFGAYDVVDRRRRRAHGPPPDGRGRRPQPAVRLREARRRVGAGHGHRPPRTCTTASRSSPRQRADAYAVAQPGEGRQGVRRRQDPAGPGAGRHPPHEPEAGETGWGLADRRRAAAPGHHAGGAGGLKTPFRPHGRVTAGNAAGLNDGATASLLAAEDVARELGLPVRMRLVSLRASPASSPR